MLDMKRISIPGCGGPLKDPEVNDGAAKGVVVGIKDQRLQRRPGRRSGGGSWLTMASSNALDPDALFGGNENGVFRIKPEILLDLLLYPLDVRRRQIDFVDDRNDFQVVFQGQIQVGQSLGFHALAGVNQQQGAFAGGQGAGNFIGEIHVARGVDEIQKIGSAVFGGIGQADRLALDGDAAFPFDIHGVENLVLEIPVGDDVRELGSDGRKGWISRGRYGR